jgi:hypothetical protein
LQGAGQLLLSRLVSHCALDGIKGSGTKSGDCDAGGQSRFLNRIPSLGPGALKLLELCNAPVNALPVKVSEDGDCDCD